MCPGHFFINEDGFNVPANFQFCHGMKEQVCFIPLCLDVHNYYQSVQTELVLFAQPTEDLLLPLRHIKAEEKGLNSGYYAHAQRTRDISRTRPRG